MTEIELKNEIIRLAQLIDAPESLVPPIVDHPIEDELVIVLKNELIRIVYNERGTDLDYIFTTRSDDALYWIFNRMVLSVAMGEDVTPEYAGLDKRRYWHKRSVEMFRAVENSAWLIKREKEIEEGLSKNAYKDDD